MMELRPLFKLVADVAAPQITPNGPYGIRRFIPVMGGRFEGERLAGRLLPGGSDCQLIRPDGVAELDVRVTLRIDDGTVVLMKGLGLRHAPEEIMQRIANGESTPPSTYYFRETMTFEAPDGSHAWLNRIIAIATGARHPDAVHITAYEVL